MNYFSSVFFTEVGQPFCYVEDDCPSGLPVGILWKIHLCKDPLLTNLWLKACAFFLHKIQSVSPGWHGEYFQWSGPWPTILSPLGLKPLKRLTAILSPLSRLPSKTEPIPFENLQKVDPSSPPYLHLYLYRSSSAGKQRISNHKSYKNGTGNGWSCNYSVGVSDSRERLSEYTFMKALGQ